MVWMFASFLVFLAVGAMSETACQEEDVGSNFVQVKRSEEKVRLPDEDGPATPKAAHAGTARTPKPPSSLAELQNKIVDRGATDGRKLWALQLFESSRKHGFHVHAIHEHHLEQNHATFVRHQVTVPLQPTSVHGNFSNRRELVRALWALTVAMYPNNHVGHTNDVMQPIWTSGDSAYGADIKDMGAELRAQQTARSEAEQLARALGNVSNATGNMTSTSWSSEGVMAVEFKRPGFGTVLCFRGTMSEADFANIKPWVFDWIRERGTEKMRYQWLTVAGLPWTAEMAHDSWHGDKLARAAWSVKVRYDMSQNQKRWRKLAEDNGIDPDRAEKTGFWEFSKRIAEVALRNVLANETFMFAGHSQGGARAALLSMYFKKKLGKSYETISFAGPGTLCFTRHMGNGANLLEDVDPYVMHPQITEYVHPLDFWGNLDYDAGNVCLLGTTNLECSAAARYCQHMYGHTARTNAVAGEQWKVDNMQERNRCLYQTHYWLGGLNMMIHNDSLLHEDGTTDGGCSIRSAIPSSDPHGLCPTGTKLAGSIGCNYQLSKEACSASYSAMGLSCLWCEEDSKCRAVSDTGFWWGEECKSGWQDYGHASRELCPVPTPMPTPLPTRRRRFWH